MTGRNGSALIFSATALVFLSAAVQAQTPSKAQQDAIRSNCRSDFMKNCSSVKPGGREALDCLMSNKANVSGGCQGALNAVSGPPPAAAKPEPAPEPKAEAKPEPAAAPAAAPATAAPRSPEPPKAPAAGRQPAPKAATAPAGRPAPPPPAEASAPPPADAAPPRPMRLGEAFVIRRYCFNDFKVLCKGVQLGQGRAVKCLADNRDALSPGCRQALANAGN